MFTFPKHASQQAWHVHVTCTIHIAGAIPSRPFGRSAISCLHGNNIQHFKFMKMTVYPLVVLTGAVLIIPRAAQILQLLARAASLILPFTHNRIKQLNKNVKWKPEDWLSKWGVPENRRSTLSTRSPLSLSARWFHVNPKIKNTWTNGLWIDSPAWPLYIFTVCAVWDVISRGM